MKKIFLPALLITCLLYVSCTKKDKNTPADSQMMSAAISSGIAFSSSGNSIVESTGISGSDTSYEFLGHDNSATLSFFVGALDTGLYVFSGGFNGNSVEYNPDGNTIYSSYIGFNPSHGSIHITSKTTTTISGTFSGSLYSLSGSDSVIVTSGQFTNLLF